MSEFEGCDTSKKGVSGEKNGPHVKNIQITMAQEQKYLRKKHMTLMIS